jgi:hypothetical protein
MYGLVKTLKTDDGREIKLVGNALTFILYKSYFGRDLLSDIVVFAKANANVESIKGYNVKTAEDINALDRETRERVINAASEYKFDSEFIINFLSALIATARYPEKPDIVSIITEIPPYFITDGEIITELTEFLSLFISQKKRVP